MCQQSSQQLEQLVEIALNQAVGGTIKHSHDEINRHLLLLEQKFLQRLLLEWLLIEKKRSFAFEVEALEMTIDAELMGFQVKLRVDRIDRLVTGERVIIDYKTSQLANKSMWLDPRMEEPQMPLYAMAIECQGVCFAKIHPKAMTFDGIQSGEAMAKGIIEPAHIKGLDVETWSQLLALWSESIEDVYKDFQQGDASIAPKSKLSCQYCDYQGICRIYTKGI